MYIMFSSVHVSMAHPAWTSPYSDQATNSTTFGALPAGYYNAQSSSYEIFSIWAMFWSSTVYDVHPDKMAYILILGGNDGDARNGNVGDMNTGYSVRCVRDQP